MNMKFTRTLLMLALTAVIGLSVTGGTIAWFTDTVTSTGNKIQPGTRDVKLSGDNTEITADTTTPIFSNVDNNGNAILWEPGYTVYKKVNIANNGSLAFKYVFGVNLSTNTDSSGVDLADVIDVYVLDAAPTTRAALTDTKKVGTLSTSTTLLSGSLVAGASTEKYIALKMSETADNDYQGLTLSDVHINLYATQAMSESDSFDSNYDANAAWPAGYDVPQAIVSVLDPSEDAYPEEINYTWSPVTNPAAQPQKLDVAYKFVAPDTVAEAEAGEYGHWHADFVVYADKDVEAESIVLAGQYGEFTWLGFSNPDVVSAGTKVRLLNDVSGGDINIDYATICGFENFNCGAAEVVDGKLAGTTMTVELRLYEVKDPSETETNTWNEETGNYITVGVFTYTF